jgi:hypothetical protein
MAKEEAKKLSFEMNGSSEEALGEPLPAFKPQFTRMLLKNQASFGGGSTGLKHKNTIKRKRSPLKESP